MDPNAIAATWTDATGWAELARAFEGAVRALGIVFCCAWFAVYVLLGSWLKVLLVNWGITPPDPNSRRFSPVFVSHLCFSLVFVNPLVLLQLIAWVGFPVRSITLVIFYLMLLPIGFDMMLLRVMPKKMTRLRWLAWTPPLRRVIPVSVFICFLAGVTAGYAVLGNQLLTWFW